MTKSLSQLLEEIEPCTCDAQFSGRDEAEYVARGCPDCICTGPMFKRVVIELAKACEKAKYYSTKDIEMYSEQHLLDVREIKVVDLCIPRNDGWVHDKRPDKPTQPYLLFPGN